MKGCERLKALRFPAHSEEMLTSQPSCTAPPPRCGLGTFAQRAEHCQGQRFVHVEDGCGCGRLGYARVIGNTKQTPLIWYHDPRRMLARVCEQCAWWIVPHDLGFTLFSMRRCQKIFILSLVVCPQHIILVAVVKVWGLQTSYPYEFWDEVSYVSWSLYSG